MSRSAVFLDRDGTLTREVGFVTRPEELRLLPGTRSALARLATAGHALVVVTNQSGVARGLYTEVELSRIHAKLQDQSGHRLAAILHSPHLPELDGPFGGACSCRKPAPGLLHQAREVLDLDFEGSFLIGDSARDLLATRGLPLRTVLVRSGMPWRQQLEQLEARQAPPDHIAEDLGDAADWIGSCRLSSPCATPAGSEAPRRRPPPP